MTRSASGVYSLPAGINPVVTLTKIASAWANNTLADLAAEMTNSLDRNGRGSMLASLKLFAGTVGAPGMSWSAEPTSGWYRAAAADFRHSVAGVDVFAVTAEGGQTYDVGGGSPFRVGFRDIPQVSVSNTITLTAAHAGKHIFHPSADTTARVWTIPANSVVAFPIGTAVTFINQNGAGIITIAITTDTMRLAGTGATGSRTLTANGVCTAVKVTATEWIISGTALT